MKNSIVFSPTSIAISKRQNPVIQTAKPQTTLNGVISHFDEHVYLESKETRREGHETNNTITRPNCEIRKMGYYRGCEAH